MARTIVPHLGRDAQHRVPVRVAQLCAHGEIAHVHGWGGPEVDVAEDAAQPPKVLVLEPGAIGPAVDAHGQQVLAGHEVWADVELGGDARILAVSHLAPVDPQVESRIHPFEEYEDLAPGPALRHGEAKAVGAGGVVIDGHAGVGVGWEGVLDVDIDRPVVAL